MKFEQSHWQYLLPGWPVALALGLCLLQLLWGRLIRLGPVHGAIQSNINECHRKVRLWKCNKMVHNIWELHVTTGVPPTQIIGGICPLIAYPMLMQFCVINLNLIIIKPACLPFTTWYLFMFHPVHSWWIFHWNCGFKLKTVSHYNYFSSKVFLNQLLLEFKSILKTEFSQS